MHKRLWLVVALLLVLVMPSYALAEESRQLETYDDEAIELRAAPVTPLREIRNWFSNTSFMFLGRTVRLSALIYLPARLFTQQGLRNSLTMAAATVVFLWWGCRKVIRIIFRAFRKGRING